MSTRLVRPQVLVVDDDPAVLEALRAELAPRLEPWFGVETASSAEEALGLVGEAPIALVISDERMPGGSGTELMVELRANARHRHGGRILVTGYAGLASAEKAINRAEVDRYFPKPWDLHRDLVPAVAQVLGRFTARSGLDRCFLIGPPHETDRAGVARVRQAWHQYLTLHHALSEEAAASEDDGAVLFLARRVSPDEDVPAGTIRLRPGASGEPWMLDGLAIDPEETGEDLMSLLVQAASVHAACAGIGELDLQVPGADRAGYTMLGFTVTSTGRMHLRTADLKVPAALPERYRRELRLCACAQTACSDHDYARDRRSYVCPLDLREGRVPRGYPAGPRS